MRRYYYDNRNPRVTYKKDKQSKQILIRAILVILVFGTLYFFFNDYFKTRDKISGLTSPQGLGFGSKEQGISAENFATTSKSLEEVVTKSLEGTQGSYAFVIKNLKTGETYSLNEHKSFDAGSLYKLWIMATAFEKIEEGSLKEDQVLSEDVASLNQEFGIASEDAEQTSGVITLTVGSALKQMITISHNYAALLLTKEIKLSSVAVFLEKNGLNQSKVGTDGGVPQTTAFDIALFFQKLYDGKITNEEQTAKMVDLLKQQKLNNKLPKYLPKGTVVAHKTGEIGWFSHDGGIVYTNKGDYLIVALSESSLPAGAEDQIANVSKAVYDYFNK